MATQVQLRRGTEAENDAFTGALAEVTVDTENHRLIVHDNSTAGGHPQATEAYVDAAVAAVSSALGATLYLFATCK